MLLHVISENEINPLDVDFPNNNGKGKYLLLRKGHKKGKDDGDPDYREVFDIDNADLSEGENESKMEYNMQRQKESTKYALSLFLQPLSQPEDFNEKEKGEVKNIKYSQPIRMGYGNEEHVVYQRIIMKNTGEAKNVYEFIKEKLERNGIGVDIVDASFDGRNVKYIVSIDGRRENINNGNEIRYRNSDMNGEKNSSWEVLVNGEFLSESIEKGVVKKNSVIEIRRKSGCGGGISYDPLTLESDPTVNKSRLPSFMRAYKPLPPSFMQAYISNFNQQRAYSSQNALIR
ncbi:MAG: hypothetical protein JSV39_03530 [Candidatus Aenigmatarchaeota archaeon]|nr:MAG: hypothetical protein JSV39_03530 [Candidatus Aenigmarchaeota archaeon]